MSFGIAIFNPGTNALVLDENFPIPEFIGKVTLNPSPVLNGRQGTAPYTMRRHEVTSMPARSGRNAMILWTLPDTGGADVWFSPWQSLVYPTDSGQPPAMDIFIGNGAGVPPLPVGYVFALGGATYSSEQFGMRIWDASGALIFDSGNKQMNVATVLTGVDMVINTPRSQGIAVPASAAFLIPSAYYIQDVQTPSDIESGIQSSETYVEFRGSVRRNGSTLYSFMPEIAHFYSYGGTASQDINDANYFGNNTGLVIPVIDATIYD